MQIYQKVLICIFILMMVTLGCTRKVTQSPIQGIPGTSGKQINRDFRKRERQAYWHKRKTDRLTRKANKKLEKSKKETLKAEEKLKKMHVEKQTPEVQTRMKESSKTAQSNTPKRTLRQRLRLWKFRK